MACKPSLGIMATTGINNGLRRSPTISMHLQRANLWYTFTLGLCCRSTLPETPRYTVDVERNDTKALANMEAVKANQYNHYKHDENEDIKLHRLSFNSFCRYLYHPNIFRNRWLHTVPFLDVNKLDTGKYVRAFGFPCGWLTDLLSVGTFGSSGALVQHGFCWT